MKGKKYTFFSDPGHGWLSVSMKEIEALGIKNKITHYSYISPSKTRVYLEEDGDLLTFLYAKFENISDWHDWYKENVKESYCDHNSPIRYLRSFYPN